jgi:biotin operon repressor
MLGPQQAAYAGSVREDPALTYRVAAQRLVDLSDDVAVERSYDAVAEALAEVRVAVARVYGGRRRHADGHGGARQRILRYLVAHRGEWVSNAELAAVSDIGEWARRIRELRVEQGYDIEEGGGKYRLVSETPDTERRDRYAMVSRLRESSEPALDRIRELFEQLVGKPVTADELDRLARGRGGAETARQLRDRELLPIESRGDAEDLKTGEHRLVSVRDVDRLHPSQRLFGEDLRRQVFTRDGYTCRTCRHRAGVGSLDGVFYLVVRHLDAAPDAVASLPGDDLHRLSRLATSCNRCYVGNV